MSSAADETVTGWALAVAVAVGGDSEAVDRFVRALQRDVLSYAAHLDDDVQAADDLAQDTFLRALSAVHRFESRSPARVWLLPIARRAVADSFRAAARRPRAAPGADWEDAVERARPAGLPGLEDGVVQMHMVEAVPRYRREAFLRTQAYGPPYAEAAEVDRCPVGTVRSRVARARTALVETMTDQPGAPGRCGPAAARAGPRNISSWAAGDRGRTW
ncbi:sigma-70 family RNA polymerase sigma factor [Streptomyces anthocyanicus]|uniref:sigma-70 family RNA polymerase sigma factor n=1 Tax=Streptomyces anthocyanicus TaxID=68174 RepID=UPI0038292B8C